MALNHNTYSGMTLKALLENPDLQHAPAALSGAPRPKDKKGDNGSGDIDFTSAFLGPQLWDKTYDAADFNLEYMDLDEFLSENDIPIVETPGLDQLLASPAPSLSPPSPPPPPPPSLPIMPQEQHPLLQASLSLNSLPSHSLNLPTVSAAPVPAVLQPAAAPPAVTVVSATASFAVKPKREEVEEILSKHEGRVVSPGAVSTGSTPPVSPVPVEVDFSLTEQDIALSSVPGQSAFNPAAHCFTEDELKPQPMIKKSKKVFVPDDMKDERYWARRKKNNYAAKRSRDARRVKENQIAIRAAYLEKENSTLKEELDKMRRENVRLKHRLSKYEASGTPALS